MLRIVPIPTVLVAMLLLAAPGPGQTSSGPESRWTIGAGIGMGVNEPAEAFDDGCDPGSRRGLVAVRGGYAVEEWLRVGLGFGSHGEVGGDDCLVVQSVEIPGTNRVYPDRVQASASYVTTEARVAVTPIAEGRKIRPLLVAGVGRIWEKGLHYPEVGIGAEVPLGGPLLQFETAARWYSVPYDLVTYRVVDRRVVETSRRSRNETHLPVLFRLGVSWHL